MMKDLSMALKNPTGEFVNEKNVGDFTRVIPTIQENIVSENKYRSNKAENDTKVEENRKPQSKLAKYLEENPKMKPVVYGGIVLGIILFCSIVFVGSWKLTSKLLGLDSSTSQTSVTLPEVTSTTIDEAKKKLEDLGITYEVEEVYSNDIEAGKVISQKPAAGTSYDKSKNSPVRLTISKGVKVVKMPKIKGLKYEEAVAELEKYELVAERVEETSPKVEEGYVIKQDEEVDQDINAGTTVKVYVSIGSGLEKVTVPYVVDTDVEEAKKQLTEKKLEVNITYQEDTNKSNGVVLKQSLDVGSVVEEGTAITLTVNKIQENVQGTININVKSLAKKHLSDDDIRYYMLQFKIKNLNNGRRTYEGSRG